MNYKHNLLCLKKKFLQYFKLLILNILNWLSPIIMRVLEDYLTSFGILYFHELNEKNNTRIIIASFIIPSTFHSSVPHSFRRNLISRRFRISNDCNSLNIKVLQLIELGITITIRFICSEFRVWFTRGDASF